MKYLLFTIAVLSFFDSGAQKGIKSEQSLSEKIDNWIQVKNRMVPINGTVLVTKGSTILLQKFFGYSNKEKKLLSDSSTVFPIASATKPFTTIAIMILQERKVLSVEDFMSKWITGTPASWKSVKLKHLLSHTSGIPDIFKVAGGDRFDADLPSLVNIYKNASLQFTPGEKFNYSNVNYIFLSYIIEVATGQTYEAFMTENIFKPLEMQHTGFTYLYEPNHMARPYYDAFKLNEVPAAEMANLRLLKGAGGIYSTSADLAKFLHGMSKLLTKESLEMMLRPVKEDYGFGWHIQEQFGKITIKHPGGVNGYVSEMRYVPADSLSVIILSNTSNNGLPIRYVAFEIMKIINNVPLDIDSTVNVKYLGKYKLPLEIAKRAKAPFLEIKIKDGAMILTIPNMPDKVLVPFARDKYFFYGEATNAEFRADGKELVIISPSMGEVKCTKE